MQKYDIIIVGAGPAGLQCAKVLAQNNNKVLVLEKNPKAGQKVCAGGITMKDLDFEIPEELVQKKFNKIIVHTERKTKEHTEDKPFLMTINREDLGEWQTEETKRAGAEILFNNEAIEIKEHSIVTKSGEFGFDFLVGADGANSFVRHHLGIKVDELLVAFQYIIKKNHEDTEIYMDPSRFGWTYIWIFPHKEFTSIGTGTDIGRTKPISDLKAEFTKWSSDKKISISNSKYEAAPINYDYEGHEFNNIFLIGDAAGFASGITGEGIFSALLSGDEIAKKIIDNNYKTPKLNNWLKQKRLQETLLRGFEINNYATEALLELTMLFRDKKLVIDIMKKFVGI